jgi:polyisoprenoid-binding protein YceI
MVKAVAKEYFKTVNRTQLKQMLDEQAPLALIDVLPPEYFDEVHIKGASNVCVYDINFAQQMESLVADREKLIVLYCNSATSRATEAGVQKLNDAGYTNVCIYRGGTIDWRRAGNPVEGSKLDNLLPLQVENKLYTIDPAVSVIQWTGRNITSSHTGSIDILNGLIPVINRRQPGKVSFLIDMDSIKDFDVQDPTWNRILVDHLKSDDFFDVKKFPTASFDSTSFQPIEGATGGGAPNYEVRGKLTIKGIAREIVFPALIALQEDGTLAAEAHFDIDRTLWNVNYGSGKFFEKLGRHLVYDHITLQLKLIAK